MEASVIYCPDDAGIETFKPLLPIQILVQVAMGSSHRVSPRNAVVQHSRLHDPASMDLADAHVIRGKRIRKIGIGRKCLSQINWGGRTRTHMTATMKPRIQRAKRTAWPEGLLPPELGAQHSQGAFGENFSGWTAATVDPCVAGHARAQMLVGIGELAVDGHRVLQGSGDCPR